MFPNIFQYICMYLGVMKSINEGYQEVEHPEIMEMLGLSPSQNKIEIFLDQNEAEYSPELFNILFKYLFHKKLTDNRVKYVLPFR